MLGHEIAWPQYPNFKGKVYIYIHGIQTFLDKNQLWENRSVDENGMENYRIHLPPRMYKLKRIDTT